MTDYSLFHVHELKSKLSTLDPVSDQEEISEIKKHIDSGGYRYPSLDKNFDDAISIMRKSIGAKYNDEKFIFWIYIILASLLVWNIYALLILHAYFSIIAILFQCVLLFALYKAHPAVATLLKIWSALLVVSGFSGLIVLILGDAFIAAPPWKELVFIFGGFYIWRKTSKSIEAIYLEYEK
jgi:hypothetical protein